MNLTHRTVPEIWQHHISSLAERNVEKFILDFSDDCLFMNNPQGGHASGVFRGPQGVATWLRQFLDLFGDISEMSVDPGMKPSNPLFFSENVVIALWGLDSKTHMVERGVDTFVIDRGQFKLITVVYDVVPKAIGADQFSQPHLHDLEVDRLAIV